MKPPVVIKEIPIPDETIASWQRIVNLMAELVDVPAALVMKAEPPYIEVFRSSESSDNPYQVGSREHLAGLYCERVITGRGKLLVPNALQDPDWAENPDVKLGMISYLGLPLLWPDGEVFGTICVLDSKENQYSKTYEALMFQFKELVEAHLSSLYRERELELIIAERKQTEEALRRHAEQLEALRQVTLDLTARLDLKVVLSTLVSRAVELLGATGGLVHLYDPLTERLVAVMSHNLEKDYQGLTLEAGEGVAGKVLQTGEPLIIDDHRVWEGKSPQVADANARSMLGAPLKWQERVIGVLDIIDNTRMGAFDEEDLQLLMPFANQAAIAIENARLYEQAQHEITERVLVEAEVRRLSQFLDSVIENVNVWLNVLDEKANIVLWNRAAEEISGYSREEVVGHDRIWDWLYPDEEYRNQVYAGAVAVIAGDREGRDVETVIQCKDGQIRIISWNSRNLVDEHGNPMGSVVLGHDITERVRAEEVLKEYSEQLEQRVAERTAELSERVAEVEQLNRALANLLEDLQTANRNLEEMAGKLQDANKELEAFTYSVSHDLRAPLRAMNGFSRILLEDYAPQLPPEAARYLRLIRDSVQEMDQLTDDLLTFSRLGRQPLRKESVAPADLARQVFEDLRDEQEDRRVEILVGDLPACQADPALLKQVWVNLIANALKFTRGREVARIEVGCQEQGGQPVYFIKDNGVGFDMRYANKLFGVFQRLHQAEEYEGTGVGLAIVQRIIHRHGGSVWAEAEVDRGATFCFTI